MAKGQRQQVVDAGIAQTLKVLTRHNYQKWLDEGENVDIWFGNQKGLTAMERRILITQCVGNAWQELCSNKYDHLRKRCWEKTGCLITTDGLEDAKITPEGLADYKVLPPLSYLPVCEAEPMSNTPDITKNDEEKQEQETLDEDSEKPENDGTEFEDCENDRSENGLCGCKVKGLYENGWFTEKIQYFNEKIGRYRVLCDDDSEDYIGIKEIEAVEIVLLD